ncbi:hypothetical protein NZD89_17850 [Alicyclobacillus fastidiosus]|uniref:Uncharacterized protein n=1 Tax=Alicyclobacillus fastidiosus TaxID=392011 RepID=A0ABY6ZBI7_9BACL|nr:hypothetical protein [Alicyclobacillus fastidiosus]WAH40231.1 hypothetical protein NZD89_17850 [Alicyclobacillus fastidiosus]GMA61593.1 hypothetical protein GCM10025859_20330 [Alicyclobacillus fastidiosus]
MEHVAYVEQTMVAYCLGKPEDLALGVNHFNETLEDIRRTGREIWNLSDAAGIVQRDEHWYLWVKHKMDNGTMEGRIYESDQVEDVLNTVCIALPWLSAYDRMHIARQVQHEKHTM